jgi:F-type H+-transporting ATPase subunit b
VLFDWFTVVAQIVNFLILIWLLKRFLYKPVLKAIDAREKRIADLLSEAEQNELQMQKQKDELSAKNAAFAKERETLLTKAKADAQQQKESLLVQAFQDVKAQRNKWLAALQKEQNKLVLDIHQRTQHAVFDIARKTLKDLSSIELEAQIIQVFIQHLNKLSETERRQFLGHGTGELLLRSTQDLNDVSKDALKTAIEKVFPGVRLRFELAPQLLSGIEMSSSGQKLSWNINDYLSSLEKSITQVVKNSAAKTITNKNISHKR